MTPDNPESGLYFYRARHYDPVRGRFLQRDPLGSTIDSGFFQYATSAPACVGDPTGLEPSTPKPIKITYPRSKKSGQAGADENKENARKAVEEYRKNHPEEMKDTPSNVGAGVGEVIERDAAGKPTRWATGTTTYCVKARWEEVKDENGRYTGVKYVYEHAFAPVMVVPDDGSVDAHETGHVEVTNKKIDESNASSEVEDLDEPDGQSRSRGRAATADAKSANDTYDTTTDHGRAQENYRGGGDPNPAPSTPSAGTPK